jgi:hypothetical protein
MYATIRRYRHVEGSTDDVARAGRELAAVLGTAPGFISCAVLEGGNGVVATVCVFEREEDLAAAGRLTARWSTEHLAALSPSAPQTTSGEVVAQKGI